MRNKACPFIDNAPNNMSKVCVLTGGKIQTVFPGELEVEGWKMPSISIPDRKQLP